MTGEKGTNKYVDRFIHFISDENKANMDYFILDGLTRHYYSGDVVNFLLKDDELSYEDRDLLLNYSGFNYKHINAFLRGTYNYEENDMSRKEEHADTARKLGGLIDEHPTILQDNITVYRGVPLSYFSKYGIESLDDLQALNGRYMIDEGFVSTSLHEEACFFKKTNDLGLNYNVKIEYMVPREFRSGIHLANGSAYNTSQQEFLLNSFSLSKVTGVTINDDDTAIIAAILVPREIYDDYYQQRALEQGQNNK